MKEHNLRMEYGRHNSSSGGEMSEEVAKTLDANGWTIGDYSKNGILYSNEDEDNQEFMLNQHGLTAFVRSPRIVLTDMVAAHEAAVKSAASIPSHQYPGLLYQVGPVLIFPFREPIDQAGVHLAYARLRGSEFFKKYFQFQKITSEFKWVEDWESNPFEERGRCIINKA